MLFACYLHTVTQHVTLKQSDVEKLSKIFMFSQTNTKRVSFDIEKKERHTLNDQFRH